MSWHTAPQKRKPAAADAVDAQISATRRAGISRPATNATRGSEHGYPAIAHRKNVSGKGMMTPDGYRPENAEHLNALTEVVAGQRVGRDPLALPIETLMAAGHGPRETRAVISGLGDIVLVEGLKNYKDLRRQCLACAENAAEVRRCICIDCPIWAFRMGKNPHNPQRGRNPFASVHRVRP